MTQRYTTNLWLKDMTHIDDKTLTIDETKWWLKMMTESGDTKWWLKVIKQSDKTKRKHTMMTRWCHVMTHVDATKWWQIVITQSDNTNYEAK